MLRLEQEGNLNGFEEVIVGTRDSGARRWRGCPFGDGSALITRQ